MNFSPDPRTILSDFRLPGRWNGWRINLVIIFVSILITTAFLVILPDEWSQNESSDYVAYYEPLARSIIDGKGYTRAGDNFESFYPPGYPLILALQFAISKALDIPEPVTLKFFLVIFTSLSVYFIFDLARRFSTTRAAIVVASLWMTYPFLLWLTKQPNSEIAFMAILFAGSDLFFSVCYIFKRKYFLFIPAGSLFGLAMLVRPIAVFYPIVLITLLWLTQKGSTSNVKFIHSLFFMIGTLIIVLPWEIFAYTNTGKVILISSNDSAAMRGGLVYAVSDAEYKQKVTVPEDVNSLMLDIKNHYEELDSTSSILNFLGTKFLEDPIALTKLMGLKALRSWYATDSQRLEKSILTLQIPYLLLILTGSWFSWKKGGAARSLIIGIWLLALCNWVMVIAVTSTLRYMVPVIGLLFVGTAQIPLFQFHKSAHVHTSNP